MGSHPNGKKGNSKPWIGSSKPWISRKCLKEIFQHTLPETNISPENEWLEYDRFLLGWVVFRGCVNFREGTVDGSEIRRENHLGWC